jgi:hypothetical protein
VAGERGHRHHQKAGEPDHHERQKHGFLHGTLAQDTTSARRPLFRGVEAGRDAV